ncbi:hypothetical protein EJ06DRAFT_479164 [Trichodelitschia bisporula]|uniref:LsmAD domain-containing protein n=1 Tax=Trichodelitschia bisporula TaxID=703511 RepID=A0A6G1HT25_9PEZI|nr:hypothetical protein EJ06DRAFT_479164 [Trichodelitschia bisporula]
MSTTSAFSINSSSGQANTSTAASPASGNRSQGKMNTNGKILDGSRKQAGSPMDQGARKAPTPNAWQKGSPNPLTHRTTGSPVVNGIGPATGKPAQKGASTTAKEVNTSDRHASDRVVSLLSSLVGLQVAIYLKSGEVYSGIFSTAILDGPTNRYALKMVKKQSSPGKQTSGATDEYIGSGPDHAMSFNMQDVVDFKATASVRFDKHQPKGANGVSSTFKTDADISAGFAPRERELQKWEPSPDHAVDMSLDAKEGTWDQFETNKRLYGVESNYDESFYTTTIDKSNPRYHEQAARADRIAREIEGSATNNSHVAEERGLRTADDADEESKYSGVHRDFPSLASGQPNKYTPPARRAPTGQATKTPVTEPAAVLAQPRSGAQKTESKSLEPAAAGPPKQATERIQAQLHPVKQAHAISPLINRGAGVTATATVEKDVVDAFKQFHAQERLKIQQHQRNLARQDKAVKLNDLKKFAENFKLNTEVPPDLVPILAKDEIKQREIVEKAKQNAKEIVKTTPPRNPTTSTTPMDQKTPKAPAPRNEASHASPLAPNDRQNPPRNRPGPQNFTQPRGAERPVAQPSNTVSPRQGPGHLVQRLAQQQYRQGAIMPPNLHQPVPVHDARVPPTGPSSTSSGLQSPSGAARFNAKAMEFRPNPAASTFLPTTGPASAASSPAREVPARTPEHKITSGRFLEGRRGPTPASERVAIRQAFNPVARMKKEAEASKRAKDFASNGGIPQAYRTPPTWDAPRDNAKTYIEMFEKVQPRVPSISPQHPALPHPPVVQHQMPQHIPQGPPMPQGHTPHQTPRHLPVQPHHGGPGGPHHFDDHRMQYSASTSTLNPPPRPMQPFISYNGQAPQQMVYQPAMPYGMNPNGHPMNMRQMSGGGPQFMAPQGAAIGGHMMTTQASNGSYVGVSMTPGVQMYTPGPAQVYQHGPMPSHSAANGYSSPRPAPMMTHQNSQQGHPQPVVFMQQGGHGPPAYSQLPTAPMAQMRNHYPNHQAHFSGSHQPQYPQQPHRPTPSASFQQQMMPHPMPPQGIPPVGGASMPADGSDDVK